MTVAHSTANGVCCDLPEVASCVELEVTTGTAGEGEVVVAVVEEVVVGNSHVARRCPMQRETDPLVVGDRIGAHTRVWHNSEIDARGRLIEDAPVAVEAFAVGTQALTPEQVTPTTTVSPDEEVVVARAVVGHGGTADRSRDWCNNQGWGKDRGTVAPETLGVECVPTPVHQKLALIPADHAWCKSLDTR